MSLSTRTLVSVNRTESSYQNGDGTEIPMPTAGIGLACSVYLVVVARRARTTAPSRLPDQGLHRFRPAEALPKERGSS